MTDKKEIIQEIKKVIEAEQKRAIYHPISISDETIEKIAEVFVGYKFDTIVANMTEYIRASINYKYDNWNWKYNNNAKARELEYTMESKETYPLYKKLAQEQIDFWYKQAERMNDLEFDNVRKTIKPENIELNLDEFIKAILPNIKDWHHRAVFTKILNDMQNYKPTKEITEQKSNLDIERIRILYQKDAMMGAFKEAEKKVGLNYDSHYDESWGPTEKEKEVLEAYENNKFTKFDCLDLLVGWIYENTCMYVDRSGLDEDGEAHDLIVSERKQDLNIEEFKRKIESSFDQRDIDIGKMNAFISELDKIKNKYSQKTKGGRI